MKILLLILCAIATCFIVGMSVITVSLGHIPGFSDILLLFPGELGPYDNPYIVGKPVLYLYPQKKQDISVQLQYKGKIIADYPKYDEQIHGWNVTAYPDGKLINHADGREYSYLFWEGIPDPQVRWNMTSGFVVKGEDTDEFLQDTLSAMGLTPKEYNEFVVYWYPQMKNNPYNIIHFADEEYTKTAPLTITPAPDSLLRVFMVFKPSDTYMELPQQEIKPFVRKGFSVVEWGGTEIR